ncbi:MAG: TonB-dependent receptor [Acidobacteriota bacterium]
MRKSLQSGLLALFLILGIASAQDRPKGQLRGFVLDLATGATLHHTVVEVLPAAVTTITDLDGMFAIALPPGEYQLVVRKPGYLPYRVEGVRVPEQGEVWQEVPLTPEGGVSQTTVEVVATSERATIEALLSERKSIGVLSDSIGRQEMTLNPGSDGADVMQRVTGVSLVDNKYVFVRGLGERYSATQLNGSQIPSTQPDKKVIAMDLFPASLLENIRTEKSYTPDQPGEFAGGIVKVNTLDFPRTPTFKITYGTGFNTLTTFKPFKTYPGGNYDFWGYDDGARKLPSLIPPQRIVRGTAFSPGFTREELAVLGRSFSNVWELDENQDAIPAQKFNVIAGNTWGPLGLVFAVNHGTDFENRRERMVFYNLGSGGQLEPFNDYQMEYSIQKARTSGTLNLAYRLGNNHKLLFRNFYTHEASDEARLFQGPNSDFNGLYRNTRLRWEEESIYSGQVSGEHYLPILGNLLFNWTLSRATSMLDQPDLRETLYESRSFAGDEFVLADESQSGFRQFINLKEVLWDPEANLTAFFQGGSLVGSVKVGAAYRHRDRDFGARRFRFVPINTRNIDLTLPPEQIFTYENINPRGFELRETTRNTDAYTALQINRAYYVMGDLSWRRWRFIGGVRLEQDNQRVETFNPFQRELVTTSTTLDNRDYLPALNIVYQLNSRMNLRVSASKTLNRPEFRELAPFDFSDVVGGRTLQGFPGLTRATIQNYDVRWEWFPAATDLVSASFFEKRFNDPIERVVEATAQLRTSFRNADSAQNRGIELDVRKGLGFLSSRLENIRVMGNYTFVDSNVELPTGGIVVLTSLSRPLAGQSRHIFNSIVEYASPRWRTVARALYNFQGARISDVGAFGIPDIIEDGYNGLDASVSQPFGDWTLKFAAQNLLDEEVRFLQGGLPQRVYRLGRTFTVSVSYSFFGE